MQSHWERLTAKPLDSEILVSTQGTEQIPFPRSRVIFPQKHQQDVKLNSNVNSNAKEVWQQTFSAGREAREVADYL